MGGSAHLFAVTEAFCGYDRCRGQFYRSFYKLRVNSGFASIECISYLGISAFAFNGNIYFVEEYVVQTFN